MRHAVIVGVKGDELELLDGGSEVEIKASFRKLKLSNRNPDGLDRIEMWTRGSGRVARFTYPEQPAKKTAKKAAKKAAKATQPDDDFGLD